jgi:tetratricopeptide (TPR) repeat protein
MLRVFVVLSVFCGCMTERIEKIENSLFQIQTGMLEVKDEVSSTHKDFSQINNNSQKQVAGMTTTLGEAHASIQILRGEVHQIRAELGESSGMLESKYSLKSRIDILSAKMANLIEVQRGLLISVEKVALVMAKQSKKSKSRRSLKNLTAIKEAFVKKQYSYVVADVAGVLKKSKKSDSYELKFLYAESLFKLGKIREAALAFNDISENENYEKFFPKVNLRLGDCFRLLGDKKVAILYYESLIKTYPKSPEAEYAKSAKEKL